MKGVDVTDRLGDCCSEYYTDVTMELVPKKEFFLQWIRQDGGLHIKTSDYMSSASDSVIRDLAVMACRRTNRQQAQFSNGFFDFVRSDDFIIGNRPLYIGRSRNLLNTDVGRSANIFDSVQRLLDSGLLRPSDIENSYFSWTKKDSKRKLGFCSTMFRVVGISSILDDPEVPDFARDYVVYHECLHLRQKFRIPHNAHSGLFRQYEHMFPDWEDVERYLSKL